MFSAQQIKNNYNSVLENQSIKSNLTSGIKSSNERRSRKARKEVPITGADSVNSSELYYQYQNG